MLTVEPEPPGGVIVMCARLLTTCTLWCIRCNAQLVAAVRDGAVALATGARLRSGSMDVGALFHGGTGAASPPAAARCAWSTLLLGATLRTDDDPLSAPARSCPVCSPS